MRSCSKTMGSNAYASPKPFSASDVFSRASLVTTPPRTGTRQFRRPRSSSQGVLPRFEPRHVVRIRPSSISERSTTRLRSSRSAARETPKRSSE